MTSSTKRYVKLLVVMSNRQVVKTVSTSYDGASCETPHRGRPKDAPQLATNQGIKGTMKTKYNNGSFKKKLPCTENDDTDLSQTSNK